MVWLIGIPVAFGVLLVLIGTPLVIRQALKEGRLSPDEMNAKYPPLSKEHLDRMERHSRQVGKTIKVT